MITNVNGFDLTHQNAGFTTEKHPVDLRVSTLPGHRKAQQEADHRECGWMILATACCVPWRSPKGIKNSPGLEYIMFDQPSRW